MKERRTTDESRTPEKVLLTESGKRCGIKDANIEAYSNIILLLFKEGEDKSHVCVFYKCQVSLSSYNYNDVNSYVFFVIDVNARIISNVDQNCPRSVFFGLKSKCLSVHTYYCSYSLLHYL